MVQSGYGEPMSRMDPITSTAKAVSSTLFTLAPEVWVAHRLAAWQPVLRKKLLSSSQLSLI
jgi:hypothetical protein